MGAERKRGKLAEFNRLLRGATDTSFVVQHGDTSILPSVRYVITLDSDTQLPMEAGRKLVGTLSHPLNRPRFDARLQRVTEGYGVLQPRISVSVVSANRTMFSRVFSGHVGVDPYTTAVSDLYQDMFHEGSYVGKGIYDVDAFEAALAGRVPENTLLSHDLFEGFYARAGLVTDTDLVDDYPATTSPTPRDSTAGCAATGRLPAGCGAPCQTPTGETVANTLPVISRWKILDNLRRSLIPPSLVLLLAAGWSVLPGSPALWTTLVVLVLAFPAYIQLARSLGSHAPGVPLREHLRPKRDTILTSLRQAVFSTLILAHQSVVMLDAIGRASVRMLVTRRRLLEWVTADRAENGLASVWTVARRMWQAPVIAVGIAAVGRNRRARTSAGPSPILILWFISPALVYAPGRRWRIARRRSGQSERARAARGCATHVAVLRGAGRTADHWLIPDNYQEDRQDVIAHRTSPTNIGLQLLSTLAAYDFGYLSYAGMLDRLEPTFDTLLRMQRYRGHFYNWYDTRTLAPLVPAYISTVDSGNLAGYLLTLRSGWPRWPTRAPHRRQCARRSRRCRRPLRSRGRRAWRGRAAARSAKSVACARIWPAARRRFSNGAACSRSSTSACRLSASCFTIFHQFEEPLLDRPAADALPAALMKPRLARTRRVRWSPRAKLELERLTGG